MQGLLLFIDRYSTIAYFGQYWASMIYAAWSLFGQPHIAVIMLVVVFHNMGGVFNFLAYTFIRRRYQAGRGNDTSENRSGPKTKQADKPNIFSTSGDSEFTAL